MFSIIPVTTEERTEQAENLTIKNVKLNYIEHINKWERRKSKRRNETKYKEYINEEEQKNKLADLRKREGSNNEKRKTKWKREYKMGKKKKE